MDQIAPGLHATPPRPLTFAPSTMMRSYLCQRETGNLLIYAGARGSDVQAIERLGGIWRHYLSHRHEFAFLDEHVGVRPFVHENDRDPPAVEVGGMFSAGHAVGPDFEVIPVPGHTPGATVYLWDRGARRTLFTGDTVFLDHGRWVAAVLDSSDREQYVASLELIRGLEFDLLVPWIASGAQHFAATSARDARTKLDRLIDRVRRGRRS